MRAEPEPRVAATADRVAGSIGLDLEPGFAKPPRGELVRGGLLRRVADTRGPDRVQLLEPLHDPVHAAIVAMSRVRPWACPLQTEWIRRTRAGVGDHRLRLEV